MDNVNTLHELVRSACLREPDKIGLTGPDGEFSFRDVDHYADVVARTLLAAGIEKGDRVVVYLEKSAQSVIIFQGILRAGAIYVPIDTQVPVAGVTDILTGCEPRVIFTTEKRAEALSAHCARNVIILKAPNAMVQDFAWLDATARTTRIGVVSPRVSEHDPAYILYTSGSTGKPKGVCLSHRNALAFVNWAATISGADQGHVFANHAPFSFGISVYDLYVPFLVGGKLVIVPSSFSLFGSRLARFIADEQVTHWYSVPSAILLMLQSGDFEEKVRASLKCLMFAGEPFPKSQLNAIRDAMPTLRLLNFYGATETNVSCYFEIFGQIPEAMPSVPIGQAACANELWIDASSRGDDGCGELVVKGPTVMLGYWGETLYPGRVYRTGDIAYQDSRGLFHFVGRIDNVVKIKGYRVALPEIEHVLLKNPSIEGAAVIKTGDNSDCKLIAFVTCKSGDAVPTLVQLKQLCAEFLPPYKVIHRVIVLSELPLNNNGKVDRRALLAYAREPLVNDRGFSQTG